MQVSYSLEMFSTETKSIETKLRRKRMMRDQKSQSVIDLNESMVFCYIIIGLFELRYRIGI